MCKTVHATIVLMVLICAEAFKHKVQYEHKIEFYSLQPFFFVYF